VIHAAYANKCALRPDLMIRNMILIEGKQMFQWVKVDHRAIRTSGGKVILEQVIAGRHPPPLGFAVCTEMALPRRIELLFSP
jgi:hypothetical protein